MHLPTTIALALAACAFPLAAQSEREIDRALQTASVPAEMAVGESNGELMRKGLSILNHLREVLAGVTDKSTADRAASQIYKISAEYQSWGQQVSARPPLSAEEQDAMEAHFLPEFRIANERLEALGQRLYAARFYSSRELVQALALFVQDTQ